MKKIINYILISGLLIFSCSHDIKDEKLKNDSCIIWAYSDIQPRSMKERAQYEYAINDISLNFNKIDMALFAGDIVQHSDFRETYQWFLDTRKQAPVKEWHEIAGNHDWRSIDLYSQYINTSLHYSVVKGNLLILMISNESPGRQTYISDETFEWWKNLVISNQNKIIITVTHGTLEGNGLFASHLERLTIKNSTRFTDILKKYRVDIWISGHSHFPAWLPKMNVINKDLGGTAFIDLGSIRKEFLSTGESRFFYFHRGSSEVLMMTRNHSGMKFTSDNFIIPLSHSFSFN